jgi:hypothetical protein
MLLDGHAYGVFGCACKRAGCHTLAVTHICTFSRERLRAQCGGGAWQIVSEEFTRYLPSICTSRRDHSEAQGAVGWRKLAILNEDPNLS